MTIPNTALFMFGLSSKTISKKEALYLQHPLCVGVILFTRNYESPKQITDFINNIRRTAGRDILVAVDHEGGRVQRFRDGFTAIPAMSEIGKIYDDSVTKGLAVARSVGYVLAYEIAACDIDFSFAPVLDVKTDFSQIIGDRGFHSAAASIGPIAEAFYRGMSDAGTAGVGKHFPGHGNVVADSHLELPICQADFDTLSQRDLPPFQHLLDAGIEAIMPAHILYTAVDGFPAGFSNFWLAHVLRKQMQFDGCIISDDLDMAGAAVFGPIADRIALAEKNCDLILLCNNSEHIECAFEHTKPKANQSRQQRLQRLARNKSKSDEALYQQALALLTEYFG